MNPDSRFIIPNRKVTGINLDQYCYSIEQHPEQPEKIIKLWGNEDPIVPDPLATFTTDVDTGHILGSIGVYLDGVHHLCLVYVYPSDNRTGIFQFVKFSKDLTIDDASWITKDIQVTTNIVLHVGFEENTFGDLGFDNTSRLFRLPDKTTGSHIDVNFFARPIGSVGGDPYVFPLHGPVVKLPNCTNYYRLLQIPSTQTVINAAVSRATPEQQAAIREQTTGLIDYADTIDDGYFLSQIFIGIEGQTFTINLEPGADVLGRTDLPWAEAGVRTGQNTTGLLQGTYQARNVQVGPLTLEVRIFVNAQIRNEVAVSLTGTIPVDTSGLLYRNYRPNLFQLGSLTCIKTQTRYKKSQRPLTQKAPVNQYEHAHHLLVQRG
jgi:hypothetical protein